MQRQPDRRFEEIYDRYREDVMLYVRRRMAADSVEDIVAETFLVCWRKLGQVPREPLPWLYAVARKILANHYRAAASRALPAGVSPPERVFLPIERDEVLARALARLTEADREVLRLVAWEQLTLRAAARVLGCSHVACRVRFHRAKRRLALHLEALQTPDAAASRPPHPEGATS
jgi:RNA polymerase sigma-70 factor (ECF subfamily)